MFKSKENFTKCIILIMMFLPLQFIKGETFSATNEDGKVIYYENGSTSAYVISGDESYKGIINIPDSVNGYIVTGIKEKAFFHASELTGVNLPKTIEYIGQSAFEGSSLQFINFSKQEWTESEKGIVINSYAFANCKNLSQFVFPKKINYINKTILSGCDNLKTVVYPESASAMYYSNEDRNSIWGDSPVTKICMNSKILEEGERFYFMSALFGNELDKDRSFLHNYYYNVWFPDSVNVLELYSDGSLNVSNRVEYIKPYSGYYGDYIYDYTLDYNNIKYIKFIANSIQSISIRNIDCYDIEASQLEKKIIYADCGIKKLKIPFAGAGTVDNHDVFSSLFNYGVPSTLESVELAEGATKIIAEAFRDCTNIKELILPSTMRGLGENALYGCSGLENLYVHSVFPPGAYENTFNGISQFQCVLHVPAGSKQYYANADGWKRFYYIVEDVDDENSKIIEVEPQTEAKIDEYYTISGIKVDTNSLKRGLYIHRNGNKSEKIFIQ